MILSPNKKLILAISILAIGLLPAAGHTDSEQTAKPVQLTPAAIVNARRAAMMLSGANMAGIKGAIDRGDDPKTAAFAATALAAWADALPGMFPAGSSATGSKAKSEVWSDIAGFSAIAKGFAVDAAQLRDYARAGNKEAFAAQWTKVRSNCAACHDKYKLP